jgi:hypothetical protein
MVTIARRFCGPSESANGGYACGLAAAELEPWQGPVEVTLRSPPPLDTPLEVERSAEGAVLRCRGQLVAEAVRTTLSVEAPAKVSYAAAVEASRSYPWAVGHPYPRCFVCGPERGEGDGLRIFPGAVAGRELVAAPWIPDESLAGPGGEVRPEVVWAALDCPSWFGLACFHVPEGRPLLGRLAVHVHQRPRAGERCVCVGFQVRSEGRKHHVGSALFSEGGELRALGQATWITLL